MGLLTIIKKQKAKNREIRVLTLGLDNSGKTTIVKCMLEEDTNTVLPTMGFQIHNVVHENHTLNIWDIGGQKTLREFWGNYYDKTNVVMWVVDSIFLERLQELACELKEKVSKQDRLTGIHLLVLINKIDQVLEKDWKLLEKRVADALGLPELGVPSEKYRIQVVSGKSGFGVQSALQWIASRDY